MKIKNKRGETITVTMVVLAALAAFLLGTTSNPIKGFFGLGGSGQSTTQKQSSKIISEPVFVTDANTGKQYVLQRKVKETTFEDIMTQPKMTLWQKLMVLPRLWLILMILGIFFPPLAAIMKFLNNKLMGETKRIVGGVEEALKSIADKPEIKQKILDILSKKYNSSTKALVSDLKEKL